MVNKQPHDTCRESVYGRYEALMAALRNPAMAPTIVLEACESQSELAKLSFPQKNITPLARNSMYKYADLVLADYSVPDGHKCSGKRGRHYLDWLRNQVKAATLRETRSRSNAARKKRAEQRNQEAKEEQNNLKAHSLRVSKAYLHLLGDIKSMQCDNSLDLIVRQRLINIVHDHDRLYSDLFNEIGTIRPSIVEPMRE